MRSKNILQTSTGKPQSYQFKYLAFIIYLHSAAVPDSESESSM